MISTLCKRRLSDNAFAVCRKTTAASHTTSSQNVGSTRKINSTIDNEVLLQTLYISLYVFLPSFSEKSTVALLPAWYFSN